MASVTYAQALFVFSMRFVASVSFVMFHSRSSMEILGKRMASRKKLSEDVCISFGRMVQS